MGIRLHALCWLCAVGFVQLVAQHLCLPQALTMHNLSAGYADGEMQLESTALLALLKCCILHDSD